jgi:hypothetical protein
MFTGSTAASDIVISEKEAARIGEKVFQNECAGKTALLTSWNKGEAFPSLGIGHFIWYPENSSGPFKESFPQLIQFMQSRGVNIPAWVSHAIKSGAPWPSRGAFLRVQQSQKMKQLRELLAESKGLQTAFMIQRLNQAMPRMLAASPASEHVVIQQQFDRVATTPMGYYALVDYVNFKGEGTALTERYQGQGWGLLQVLQNMESSDQKANALIRFSESAKRTLARRVKLSPPERQERRWLKGWKKR